MAALLSCKGVFSGLNRLARPLGRTGESLGSADVFSISSGSCDGTFDGVKSVPLLRAAPLIPVFFGDADRGGSGVPRRDFRVDKTCVGSSPLPVSQSH